MQHNNWPQCYGMCSVCTLRRLSVCCMHTYCVFSRCTIYIGTVNSGGGWQWNSAPCLGKNNKKNNISIRKCHDQHCHSHLHTPKTLVHFDCWIKNTQYWIGYSKFFLLLSARDWCLCFDGMAITIFCSFGTKKRIKNPKILLTKQHFRVATIRKLIFLCQQQTHKKEIHFFPQSFTLCLLVFFFI